MGKLREATGRELLGHVRNPDQAMFQLLLLVGGRRATQDLQPPIDLDRVAADGDRIFPALPQEVGEGDRDAGLPGRGRPEDGDDVHGPLSRRG